MDGKRGEERPQLASDLVIRSRPEGSLLLSPARAAWCVVDAVGGEVARQCDGTRTLRQIVEHLTSRYQVAAEQVEADVEAYLDELQRAGLGDTEGRGGKGREGEGRGNWETGKLGNWETSPDPLSLISQFPSATLGTLGTLGTSTSLRHVGLHVTNECNLCCRHCYKSPSAQEDPALAPPRATLCQWIDQARSAGAESLSLTGGEVLVRPDWPELVAYATARLATTVVTNGTLVDEDAAAYLARSGVQVQLSLDGTTAPVHEALRGPGTFAMATAGLRRLLAHGLGPRLTLATTVTRLNQDDVLNVVPLAAEWGVGHVYFLRVTRQGRAVRQWSELAVDDKVWVHLTRHWSRQSREYAGVVSLTGCLATFARASLGPNSGELGCPVGQVVEIDTNGDVYPCILLNRPEFCGGNLEAQSLAEILESDPAQQVCRDVARRPAAIPACQSCDWRGFCQGACPGLALQVGGGFWQTDDLCALRDEMYTQATFELARERAESGN